MTEDILAVIVGGEAGHGVKKREIMSPIAHFGTFVHVSLEENADRTFDAS
ncbi:MAG: hypothetical protein ACE5QW_05390 [Thermoplasmata archaeon]